MNPNPEPGTPAVSNSSDPLRVNKLLGSEFLYCKHLVAFDTYSDEPFFLRRARPDESCVHLSSLVKNVFELQARQLLPQLLAKLGSRLSARPVLARPLRSSCSWDCH